MDDLEIFMETKKYVESVLGNDKVDFNDSVIEQIAELYLEKLASSNINISNVMVDDLVKNEDLVWSCYDEYIKMPNKRTVSNYEPPIDLMIRTSKEYRISNFMLWQMAYAELYFTNILWPDFDDKEFDKAIEAYNNRDRRFGSIKK